MAKTKDGFYKQSASGIGSDALILLAGGGTKALSELASSSSLSNYYTKTESDKKYAKGNNIKYNKFTTASTASDGWYDIFTCADNTNSPCIVNVRAYAHSSMIFTVTKGWATSGNISILEYNSSSNASYAYVRGARILSDGKVQINLHTGSNVDVEITVVSTGNVTLSSTLVCDTTAYSSSTSVTVLDSKLGTDKTMFIDDLSVSNTVTANKFTGNLNNTLTFSAGAFSAKTYNNSAAVTVNVPTHTSHLTNNSGFLTSLPSHTHSYLPLTGGTISNTSYGPLIIERKDSTNMAAIKFKNSSGDLGSIGMNTVDGNLLIYNAATSAYRTILDSGNYTTWINTTNFPGLNKTGTVTQVKIGSTAYNPLNGIVSLPAYPTSLPANGGTADGAYYVYDYNSITTPIYIGFANTGLTSTTANYLAAYGLNGTKRVIKDISAEEAKKFIGLGNVANYDLSKAIKTITRSGTTFTYTCIDGTTGTFTQQDNNTTYNVFGKTINASFKTAYRTLTKGNTSQGYYIAAIRNDTSSVTDSPTYGSGLAFGMADTHGYLYLNYNAVEAYLGAGNADKLNWVKKLAFADGTGASGTWAISVSGNAATSSRLKILDLRDTNHLPNSSNYPAKHVTGWFNSTGTPTSAWYSGLTIKGWDNTYQTWLIASGSSTSINEKLYYRCGITNSSGTATWNAWKQIAFVTDISNYYWANVKVSATSSETTTPKFSSVTCSNIYCKSNGGGNIGSSSTRFACAYFSNKVYAVYGFYESSDERLKDFYEDVEVDLEKISQLPKKYFKWKDNSQNLLIGTSAQELQKIYPELVSQDDQGILSVAYDKLSIIALKGIDKLYEQIKELRYRVEQLENK